MITRVDVGLGAVKLPVREGRKFLWGKTKASLQYIYENHLDDADWFIKADDDTYVIMENLRYLVYPYSPQRPIFFGLKFKEPDFHVDVSKCGHSHVYSVFTVHWTISIVDVRDRWAGVCAE